jgi:hypothetical protein
MLGTQAAPDTHPADDWAGKPDLAIATMFLGVSA